MEKTEFIVNLRERAVTHLPSGMIVMFDEAKVGEIPVKDWYKKYSLEYIAMVADKAGELYYEKLEKRHSTMLPTV